MSESGGKLYGAVNADCLDVMKRMSDNSVDAIVTDPPYGISFMSKGFDTFKKEGMTDNQAFQADMTPLFKEMLRIAKPGAHLLAFGGTRTYHRLTCAIEDAGWEVRDTIMYCYGSGFPKSMDIGKALGKKGSSDAEKWNGWGTCLKPAYEPIVVARKPPEGTVADNVLKHGVGGLNIEACRVPTDENLSGGAYSKGGVGRSGLSGDDRDEKGAGMFAPGKKADAEYVQPTGRFPANVIHDGSDEVLACFPDNVKGGTWNNTKGARHFENNGKPTEYVNKGSDKSVGSAARFFYCAKASKKERGEGNTHPTVKPIALMKYLVQLVTPTGGAVLDPFMGSGTTGVAAIELGRRFLGIEKETEYFKIAESRLEQAKPDVV